MRHWPEATAKVRQRRSLPAAAEVASVQAAATEISEVVDEVVVVDEFVDELVDEVLAEVLAKVGIGQSVSPREVLAEEILAMLQSGPVISRREITDGGVEVVEWIDRLGDETCAYSPVPTTITCYRLGGMIVFSLTGWAAKGPGEGGAEQLSLWARSSASASPSSWFCGRVMAPSSSQAHPERERNRSRPRPRPMERACLWSSSMGTEVT